MTALGVVALALGAVWAGGPPAAQISGVSIQATHILILVDDTTSMSAQEIQEDLTRQRTLLEGLESVRPEPHIQAFGVSSSGYPSNLLYRALAELPRHPEVDALYVFSDFHPYTPEADCDDQAGLAEFRALVRKSRVRLYLSSAEMVPSPGLVAIAEESGGGLIGVRLKSSSEAPGTISCPER